MNKHLQQIEESVQQNDKLTTEQKESILKSLKEADKELEVVHFKLERTEKVKRTTAILLEETIAELELKRKAVEAQNRELEIETALEKVRARTMAMQKSDELPETSHLLFEQMKELGEPVEQLTIGVVQEENNVFEISATLHGDILKKIYQHSIDEPFMMSKIYHAWKTKQKTLVIELKSDELNAYNKYRNELTKSEMFPTNLGDEHRRIVYAAFFSKGMLALGANEPRPPESLQLLERFAGVFDQAYTRFVDLKKAEAQARESQIQLALERLRARTMAMHESSELNQTAELLFDQLKQLGAELQGVAFAICDKNNVTVQKWTSIGIFSHPYTIEPGEQRMYEAWKNQVGIYEEVYDGERIKKYFELFMEIPAFREGIQKFIDAGYPIPTWQKNHAITFKYGYLLLITTRPFAETEIFVRFGKVFEQTYTRFLDLQKAEAQTKEAQIEAALERVRSKTMAMHHSEELLEVITTLTKQLQQLEFRIDTANFNTNYRSKDWELWTASHGTEPIQVHIPYFDHPIFNKIIQKIENGEDFFSDTFNRQEKDRFLKHLFENTIYKNIPDERKEDLLSTEGFTYSIAFSKHTSVTIGNYVPAPYSQQQNDILKRFGYVFEQSYTRFLDLKKAEAQAREAQIEAALEKVRSRTMAMQKSEDLNKAASDMFKEIQLLGMHPWGCGFNIFDKDEKTVTQYMSLADGGISPPFRTPLTEDPFFINIYDARQRRDELLVMESKGESLAETYRYMFGLPGSREIFGDLENSGFEMPKFQITHCAYFSQGYLVFITYENVTEAHDIFKRFAKVFEQTYTRFLDLQRAEEQAREATIEAALERVRGKAMAMHNSNDLSVTASMVFTELRKLGITPIRCGVGLLNKESRKAQLYSATSSSGDDSLSLVGWVELSGHPVLDNIYDTWLSNTDYFPELSGEQLKSYYELLLKGLSVKVPESDHKQYGTFLPFTVGCLYAWSETPYNEAEVKILKRFANIIDLTFRRYLELQKSEANAKEAIKQAALDRIRADIASMRTIADLERITPLIWNELTTLGIPFIRCGVFIMDDSQQLIHTFLSTPDGKAIAAFHLPYNTPGNIGKVVSHWRDNQNYIDRWNETSFEDLASMLVKQGAIASPEQYLNTIPHGGFYLHFLPFLQGMLYVGNSAQLGEEEINIIQSLADAFSTAYARYEDFNKLEAAKKQVDSTLKELQATQKQLIQSEKMASLGELTAGIAHEIQNPLNFVNNFSDVSNELIDEMVEEVKKGNITDATAIANDIKQNLEKINHHGKRADAIVKGMLQHSRTSSGQKELTDINALCDEYLRLAYHGLRAKDKSFNAKFETSFDNIIEKINIVPQDIGRVILNLINNAFYAVNERLRQVQPDSLYEPAVSVSTKKANSKIEISIKDNGNGIPDSIKEKIFQPFFTTKPTGQGTGLGLSLSYDIVKAHGGEIKLETKDGEGTTFIIQLNTLK